MAVVVHVDLCTNRSGSDNSTHQSRPHNPFLKDRTNGRQQNGRTAQHGTTKPTQNNKRQQRKKKGKNTQNVKGDKKKSVCHYHARHDKGEREVAAVNGHTGEEEERIKNTNHYRSASLC